MSRALRKLTEAFTVKTRSGTATPPKTLVYETPSIALTDVMKLYERDPTCKASVDLLKAKPETTDAAEKGSARPSHE